MQSLNTTVCNAPPNKTQKLRVTNVITVSKVNLDRNETKISHLFGQFAGPRKYFDKYRR